MADLNEADPSLELPQPLHEAVDPIARQAEDRIDAPRRQPLEEDVGDGVCHDRSPGSSTSRSKFAAFCIARSRGNLHHIQLRNFNAVAEAFDESCPDTPTSAYAWSTAENELLRG